MEKVGPAIETTCTYCGEPFTAKNTRHKFCRPSHRVMHARNKTEGVRKNELAEIRKRIGHACHLLKAAHEDLVRMEGRGSGGTAKNRSR